MHWDIFCAVVDNYGDAGVCWRLARQLVREHGASVRLWVDRPATLRAMAPGMPDADVCVIDGVEVHHWRTNGFEDVEPADVVIEAFACELPAKYLARMAARERAPAWINLEYLSAEDWVVGCHGLTSPDPRRGLTRHFFFPGFTAGTGGLIKESDLDTRRTAWLEDTQAQTAFWARLGIAPPPAEALKVSLFAYDNAALPALLDAWAAQDLPVHCAVPLGRSVDAIARWAKRDALNAGTTFTAGALTVSVLPFMAQDDYDYLLWSSDLNFVRGEDSFVRAQWARRPFIWHIYPQTDDAHMDKLAAFLAHYEAGLPPACAAAVRAAFLAWNGLGGIGQAWPALRLALPELVTHAAPWAEKIAKQGDLADNLTVFCRSLVQ